MRIRMARTSLPDETILGEKAQVILSECISHDWHRVLATFVP